MLLALLTQVAVDLGQVGVRSGVYSVVFWPHHLRDLSTDFDLRLFERRKQRFQLSMTFPHRVHC